MLPCKYCGRNKNGALLALAYAFKGRTESHLGLTEAHIAAQQPLHGNIALHIRLYFVYTAKLIGRFLKLEPPLKVVLHVGIGRKCVALCVHPRRIKGD